MGHPSGRGDWLGSGHSSWRSFISSTKQFGRADLLTVEWFWKQRQSQSGRLSSFRHFLPTPRPTSISFHLVGHAVFQMQVSSNSNSFGSLGWNGTKLPISSNQYFREPRLDPPHNLTVLTTVLLCVVFVGTMAPFQVLPHFLF